MAPIPYQVVGFTFGATDRATGKRHAKVGDLVLAENVRQIERSQYRKRRGYARTAPSVDAGSWTAPADSTGLVPVPGGCLLTIDGAGVAWCYDPDTSTLRNRGTITRPFPQHTVYLTAGRLRSPTVVLAGGDLWHFAVTTDAYWYSVTDATTGVSKLAPTKITTTSVVQISAAYDGTSVWVFWTDTTTTVRANKFSTTSPGTAPTVTTYATAGGGITTIDAFYFTGLSKIAVVMGNASAVRMDLRISYLDPATGAESASPAASAVIAAAVGAGATIMSPAILVSSGTTTWYMSVWEGRTDSGVGNQARLRLYDVTSSTLATSSVILDTKSPGAVRTCFGVSAGYVNGSGDRVVFQQFDDVENDLSPWNWAISQHVRGGVTTDNTRWAAGSWLAGRPAQVGSTWYIPTGYDDAGRTLSSSIQSQNVQRTCHLRDSSGNIIGQALSGQAGGAWNTGTDNASASISTRHTGVAATVIVGNVVFVPCLMLAGTVQDLAAGSIAWDTAPTYGLPVACRGRALVPGGIPVVFGATESVREVTPLVFPNYFTVSAGATSTDIAIVYRFTSPDGTFWRSSPCRGTISIANAATITVPTLRHLLTGTKCTIELYAGTTGVPYFQEGKENDTTADTITFTYSSTLKTDEALYNVGGALSNAPAPPCKHVAVWNGRAFFGATPERDVVWCSQEFAPGVGIQLNEVLRSTWLQGKGEVLAMADTGSTLALFRSDAIAVLNGSGPDGRGAGAFIPQTIEEPRGATNWRSMLKTGKGLLFQGTDGLMYSLAGVQVLDAFAGMADYSSATVVGALLDEDESNACFFLSTGVILALDYAHATAEQPIGVWYDWTSANLNRAYGACVDSSGIPKHIESTGVLRTPTDSLWTDASSGATTPVLMKLTTSKLAPVGMQGGCRVEGVALLGTCLGVCDVKLTIASGAITPSTHTKTLAVADPFKVYAKPPALGRVIEVQVTVEESANSGGTEGFVFDGLGLNVQPLGGLMFPESGERI